MGWLSSIRRSLFSLGGSTAKPFATVRNITFSNIKVECKSFGDMQGNPSDTVSKIVFKNIEATAATPGFRNKYTDVKMENVVVNGKPLVQ